MQAINDVADVDAGGEDAAPRSYDLAPVRRLHSSAIGERARPGDRAFWCEWNHPLEGGDRTLDDLVRIHNREWNWQRYIRPGDSCIDIGAHSGDTAIPMAICAYDGRSGQRGTVVAVEPNPHVLPVLEINLALNAHLAEFHCLRRAVTDRSGVEVTITDHGNRDCNGGIISDRFSGALQERLAEIGKSTFTALGETLEDICTGTLTEEQLGRLSFVKTDCEGYDKEILRSSKAFLARFQPLLFVEWFLFFTEADSADLFRAVDEIGYVALHPFTMQRASVGSHVSDLLLVPAARIAEFASA